MTDAERTELHDRTIDRMHAAIHSVLAVDGEYQVLRRIRWRPLEDFPNVDYLFDIAIVDRNTAVVVEGAETRIPNFHHVATIIDVIDSEWESELYDRPDTLLLSSVYEYVVYDPSSDRLRPNMIAVRKGDLGFEKLLPAVEGTFFSYSGFRLDAVRDTITAVRCGRRMDEEELWECRREFRKNPSQDLAARIQKLEVSAVRPRRRRGEE